MKKSPTIGRKWNGLITACKEIWLNRPENGMCAVKLDSLHGSEQ